MSFTPTRPGWMSMGFPFLSRLSRPPSQTLNTDIALYCSRTQRRSRQRTTCIRTASPSKGPTGKVSLRFQAGWERALRVWRAFTLAAMLLRVECSFPLFPASPYNTTARRAHFPASHKNAHFHAIHADSFALLIPQPQSRCS